jgi:hypothetical protein
MLIGVNWQAGRRWTIILYAVISDCCMKIGSRRQQGRARGFAGYEQANGYVAGSINYGLVEKNHTCINIVAFIIVTLYM